MTSMVVLALLFAAPASAKLVPQRSLGGVKIGMTEKEVRAERGAPDEVSHPRHPIAGKSTVLRYGRTHVTLLPNSGVINIRTTSRRETYRGTGVGSTEAAVRRAVKGERCATEYGYRTCHLGRLEPGRVVTTWHISRSSRKVTRISLGRVID